MYKVTGFLFCMLAVSCTNVRRAAKGYLGNGSHFEILYFSYISAGHRARVRNCDIFNARIKNRERKIKEELVWYSCDSMLPMKIFFTKTSDTVRLFTINLLIADTTGNSTFSLNEEEQKTLWAMNAWFANHHYPACTIRGFKTLSKKDSLLQVPFLRRTILLKYYGRE